METSDLLYMGWKMMAGIQEGVSKQTLAQIYLVAFSLNDKDGNHIFDEIPEFLYNPVGSMDADKLSDSNLVPKSSRTYEEEGDEDMEGYDEKLANCYCYLACSYFRLYSKSAENFVKIQEHLKKRFTNFFSYEMMLSDFSPDLDTVKYYQTELRDHCSVQTHVLLYTLWRSKQQMCPKFEGLPL
jgi:hypothetical protein